MKQVVAMLLVISCLFMSGCGSWMSGSYVSITPYLPHTAENEQDTEWINDQNQLVEAIRYMVNRGMTEDIFFIRDYSESEIASDTLLARYTVMKTDPIGAYAVQDIGFEVGVNGGRSTLRVTIDYSRQNAEVLRIQRVQGMKNAGEEIAAALDRMDPELVIYVEDYEPVDFVQMVADFSRENPDVVMELPQVSVSIYPENGPERVVELDFTYQNSRDVLRNMQSQVKQIFESAKLYVSGDETTYQTLSHLYVFLMERSNYRTGTSMTPAYSLLRHGVGDSKAFAVVFAAMCRNAGLECMTVSGTRNGESWFWNIVKDGDVYCHVDILYSAQVGMFLERSDAEMNGYVWDYSAYPACQQVYVPTEPTEENTEPTETGPVIEPTEPSETTLPEETEQATEVQVSTEETAAEDATQETEPPAVE